MSEKVFVSNLPVAVAAINAASLKALRAAADQGRNQTLRNFRGSRTGHTYKVPGTNRHYTASAPGEFPAASGVRTGHLQEMLHIQEKGDEMQVGTSVEYGLALEKKPPSEGGREWLRPSLEQAKPAMLRELAKRWL